MDEYYPVSSNHTSATDDLTRRLSQAWLQEEVVDQATMDMVIVNKDTKKSIIIEDYQN
jgi:hypothetical protein